MFHIYQSSLSFLGALTLLIALPGQSAAQSSAAAYEAYARKMPERIWNAAADVCGPRRPTPQKLEENGFQPVSAVLWQRGAITVSYGDPLSPDASHHCIVSALYAGNDRPAGAGAIFEEAMARSIRGRFDDAGGLYLTLVKSTFNYQFSLKHDGSDKVELDGAIIPPSPAVGNEVGGLLLNIGK